MYAVIAAGGKQERVEVGSTVEVELLGAQIGEEVQFTPVLVVDGATVTSAPEALSSASVAAKVLGESKGPKITGFTYRAKARGRRRFGHRQHYTTVEITNIMASGAAKKTAPRTRAAKA